MKREMATVALLEVRDLHYRYPGGTAALRGVSLKMEKGEMAALMGPNGSGKTTLMYHLVGLLRPQRGRLLFRGRDIPPAGKSSSVGLVFQDPNDQLFAPTVEEDVAFGPQNMALPAEEVRRRVKEAMSAAGILGLEKRPIQSLSYGQKRRVAIAGVLAMEPEFILLDEPAAGLDPGGVEEIMSLVSSLNRERGVTVLMSTHDVDLVPEYMSRVLVLHEGQILADGMVHQVFSRVEVLSRARLKLPRVARVFRSPAEGDGQRLPLTVEEGCLELARLTGRRGRG